MNKYRAKKTEYNGVLYDSKKEAYRARQLDLLFKAGKISRLERQVKFCLQEGFVNNQGKKIRPIDYIADFVYYDEEKKLMVAEDSKGFRPKEYILKRKMFEYKYKDYLFIES